MTADAAFQSVWLQIYLNVTSYCEMMGVPYENKLVSI
jgi:hypothetical protein